MRRLLELLMVLAIASTGVILAGPSFSFSSPGFVGAPRGSSASTFVPISNALVAGWSFDDGTGAAISPTSYVNGFTLTNNNTVLCTNLGAGSNAMYFISANSEYLSYAADNRLARTGSMTIAFAYFSTGATNAVHTFVSKGSNDVPTSAASEYSIIASTTARIGALRGDGLAGSGSQTLSASNGQLTNSWQHFTMVFSNGVGWAIYTNGVLDGTSSLTNTTFNSTGDFRIGRASSTSGNYAQGMLREIYVWREAKDSVQCSNIYRAFTNNAKYPAWGNTY